MRTKWSNLLIAFVTGEVIIGILLYLAIKNYNVSNDHYFMDITKGNRDDEIQDQSLYEYYKIKDKGGNTPLLVGPETFFLNGKSLTILSGAIHYFRVHPKYWRDRLKKLRAMGANTVETYIPWNLHEPEKDHYDFGAEVSATDYPFSEWLDVVKFIKMAKEEDLFVILRPSPYICAEWDFGGIPSYLLQNPGIKVRSNDPRYLERVSKYFDQLLPRFSILQIEHGGPILMFQIENEYGRFADVVGSKNHLRYLKRKMQEANINGLFVTSDGVLMHGASGALVEDDVLMTANFQDQGEDELAALKDIQPFKAAMVMEFWTGWFDHWGKKHSTHKSEVYAERLSYILEFPASVNLYMFHGGTNFGFMNGANQWTHPNRTDYEPDTTSYDYDAPLTENGNYTEKYYITRQLFMKEMLPLGIKIPEPPELIRTISYPSVIIEEQLNWNSIVASVFSEDRVESDELMPMEALPLFARKGNGKRGGQSYGFILYRLTSLLPENPTIQIKGRVRDMATIMVDDIRQTDVFSNMSQRKDFGFWGAVNGEKTLELDNGTHVLDILVENMGRNNYGLALSDFDQRKGLLKGTVLINNEELKGLWHIMALDFQPNWVLGLKGWSHHGEESGELISPTMFKAYLNVEDIYDTFIDMRGWGKGVVFVNGFNIGRYFSIGPQFALYVPAPLLKKGMNTIIIFELFTHSDEINFSPGPIFK